MFCMLDCYFILCESYLILIFAISYTKICESFVLFKYNATISQDRQADTWADKPSLHSASQPSIVADVPLPTKRDSLFAERESQLDSLLPSSSVSLYGQDSSLSGFRSSALSRAGAPIVTTVSNFKCPYFYLCTILYENCRKCDKYNFFFVCYVIIFTNYFKNIYVS